MTLTIYNKNGKCSRRFCEHLKWRMGINLRRYCSDTKFRAWDAYITESNIFGSNFHPNTRKTIFEAFKRIVIDEYGDKYILHFDFNYVIPNTDIKLINFIKLITYGNTEHKGYPIILSIFDEVAKNLTEYADVYCLLY